MAFQATYLLIYIIAITLVISRLLKKYKQVYKSLDGYKVPAGPPGLPLLGNFLGMVGVAHTKLHQWAEEYGKMYTIRLGNRYALVVSDAKLMKELFGRFASTGKFKTDSMLLVSRGLNGVINTEGKVSAEQRSFGVKSLKIFGFGSNAVEDMCLSQVRDVLKVLTADATSKGKTIPHKIFQRGVSNALWTLVTGKKFGGKQAVAGQKEDEVDKRDGAVVYKYLDDFAAAMQYTVKTGLVFLPWLRHISKKWSGYNDLDKACADFHNYFQSLFTDYKSTFQLGSAPRQLVDCYLQHMEDMKNNEKSSFYGDWGYMNSVAAVGEIFIGGVITTSTTLVWMLLELCYNQEAQNKLINEIDEVIGSEREPSLLDKIRMPYTDALLTEGHRAASVLPLGVIHELLQDTKFHEYYLPQGIILIPNLYHIHRDKDVWGDPDTFRPERFLENPALKDNVLAFQAGKRSCPGETLAKDFIFLMVTSFFQKFRVTPDPSITKEAYFKPDIGLALMPDQLDINIHLRNA